MEENTGEVERGRWCARGGVGEVRAGAKLDADYFRGR